MLEEALKAIGDCDIVVYLAPASDKTVHYEKFLELNHQKRKHIIVLSKIDQISQGDLLKKIGEYNQYSDQFDSTYPYVCHKKCGKK